MAENKTLLVVDGHSAAFRAFYALDPANFRTQEGQYTNAVFGFLRMLVKMLQEAVSYTHLTLPTTPYV